MALVLADRVKETTTTTGTATYTLAGASTGFESFASIGDGNTTYYACTDGTDFEVGIGTYTASGTTLARTTILQSSNSDLAVSWSAGTKTIFCCQPAEKAVFLDASGNIATFNGSNLTNVNATTLDSLDSTSFLRSDAADTKTSGNLTFSDNVSAKFGTGDDLSLYHDGTDSYVSNKTGDLYIGANDTTDVGGDVYLRAKIGENDTSIALMDDSGIIFYSNGSITMQMYSAFLYIYDDVTLQSNSDLILDGGNFIFDSGTYNTTITPTTATATRTLTLPDASGTVALTSDLPTATSDLTNDSGFITSADGGNAQTLDSLDSTSFLRSDADDNKTSGNLTFEDNIKARFGTSGDLQIYHDGSNSFINDVGTGSVVMRTNGSFFQFDTPSTVMAKFIKDGAVELRHNNNLKFETTSTGATVTGVLASDGVDLGDNEKLRLGASQDLEIFHNGSHSFIQDLAGTGALYIATNQLLLTRENITETFLEANVNGSVDLYYDGSKKLETTSTGATVTGTLIADGLDIARDTDASAEIGRAHIGNVNQGDHAGFSHVDQNFSGNYALLQSSTGNTFLNAASGQTVHYRINNSDVMTMDNTGLDITGNLTLTSTDAGATENPTLDLYRNSASPAVNDVIGHITFSGENDASEKITYAEIETIITDETDGTEDSSIKFNAIRGGSSTTYYQIGFGVNQFHQDVLIESSDAGATENPTLDLYRNSASPADNDVLGHIDFSGEDSAGNKTVYAKINADITDVTDGTEDGRLDISVIDASSLSQRIVLRGDSVTSFLNRDVRLEQNVDLIFEGATSNDFETTLTVTDPTADRTITLPDASGTVPVFTTAPTSAIADGTNGQVLTTNGSGALSFTTVSGGSSTLSGLTDVTITSVQNNDLLKYNSTAGEWQNTNLGISVAPTVTLTSTLIGVITASLAPSSGTYDQPAYFAEVRNSSNTTTIVTNDNITKSGNTLSFTLNTIGSFILRVKTQDFGDLESEFTNQSFTTTAYPTARYLRLSGSGGSTHTYVRDLRFYTDGAQAGTEYPTSDMTSNTAPSPFVASSSGAYTSNTSYQEWKAFDFLPSSTGFWNLGQSSTYSAWFLQLDIGTAVSINSAKCNINPTYYGGGQTLTVSTSNSSTFASGVNTIGSVAITGGGDFTFN